MNETSKLHSGFVDGLNDAVRANPLAAALVGAGAFWMLFRNVKPMSTNSLQPDASTARPQAQPGHSMSKRAATLVVDVQDTARDAIEQLQKNITSTGDTVMEGVESAASLGRRYGSAMQTTLAANLERQPLLIGALGLAIGAGIASTFPATKIEDEILGESAAAARQTMASLAGDAKDIGIATGEKILDDARNEASHQGLTGANAENFLIDTKQKVGNVARAAEDSVKKHLSGSS